MVTIEKCSEGRCMFCFQDREGVQAAFADGLRGFLCQKHFWQAVRVRTAEAQVKTDTSTRTLDPRVPHTKPA